MLHFTSHFFVLSVCMQSQDWLQLLSTFSSFTHPGKLYFLQQIKSKLQLMTFYPLLYMSSKNYESPLKSHSAIDKAVKEWKTFNISKGDHYSFIILGGINKGVPFGQEGTCNQPGGQNRCAPASQFIISAVCGDNQFCYCYMKIQPFLNIQAKYDIHQVIWGLGVHSRTKLSPVFCVPIGHLTLLRQMDMK